MKTFLKILLVLAILFGIFVAVIVFLFNMFKPKEISLKDWFSTKQVDLGVKSTQDQYKEMLSSLGLETKTSACVGEVGCTPKYSSETVKVEKEITNEVGSSLINGWGDQSKNAPFSNAQMRVNADGTVEFSGMVSTTKLGNLLSISSDIGANERKEIDKYLSKLGGSFPVYASGTLSIVNNQVDLNISSVKAGILPIPSSLAKQYKGEVDSFVENRLGYVKGLNVESLQFKDGKTIFKGTLPKSIEYRQ